MEKATENRPCSAGISTRLAVVGGLMLTCLIGGLFIGREFLQSEGKAVTWAAVFEEIEGRWPSVPQMPPRELARRLARPDGEARTLLIDVRQRGEYDVSHLPGAVHAASPGDIRALIREVPPERDVVLYCSVGVRSSEAVDRLMAGGRTNVYNLRGSMFQWANDGHPVMSNGLPAGVVHPYNREWGRLLNTSFHPGNRP